MSWFDFLRVCPSHLNFLILISSPTFLCFVRRHSSSFEIKVGQNIWNIRFRHLLTNTCRNFSSLAVRNQVSEPYNKTALTLELNSCNLVLSLYLFDLQTLQINNFTFLYINKTKSKLYRLWLFVVFELVVVAQRLYVEREVIPSTTIYNFVIRYGSIIISISNLFSFATHSTLSSIVIVV